jgi:hypothetical protein
MEVILVPAGTSRYRLQALSRASEIVEDFRGDYDQLAEMMRASWGESPTPPYLHTAEFMADWFGYPGASPSLAPSIYHGSDLVAFVAGYPRTVLIDGVEMRLLISTFLTVAPAEKASGYGIVLWGELMRRAAGVGFDGAISYCAEGHAMNRMIEGSSRLFGLPLLRATSLPYLIRPISEPGGERAKHPSARDLLTAAAAMREHADLCRVWTEAEAAWQLSRVGAVAVRGGTDREPAVLTGHVMSIDDADQTRCVVIQDILWGSIGARDRQALGHDLIMQAASRGARVAILPLVTYADMQPFAGLGFFPTPHTVHAYLTVFSEAVPARPQRYYLDVS